jgi:hypothetical protein
LIDLIFVNRSKYGENKTLKNLITQRKNRYIPKKSRAENYRKVMEKMRFVDLGGPYTREQLNERR